MAKSIGSYTKEILGMLSKTKKFFGVDSIVVPVLCLVALWLGLFGLKAAGFSSFSIIAIVWSVAFIVGSGVIAKTQGAKQGIQFLGLSSLSIAILFLVGATGIFSFSESLQWSSYSALVGAIIGSVALIFLQRKFR